MKKYIILFCAILLFNINVVAANEEYTCQYYKKFGADAGAFSGGITYQFRFVVNKTKKTVLHQDIPSSEKKIDKFETGKIDFLMDYTVNTMYNDSYYVDLFSKQGENFCPEKVYICEIEHAAAARYGLLFNDPLQGEISNSLWIEEDVNSPLITSLNWKMHTSKESCYNVFGLNDFVPKFGRCEKWHFEKCQPFSFDDGEYSGKGNSGVISYDCNRYTNNEKTGLKDDVEAKSNAYKDCEKKNGSGCSLEKLATEYNQAVEKLKSYCNNVIQNQNYGDVCMTSCLGMIDDLKSLEIEKTTETNECYLTDEIISFVYNVLKYAKYIAPVLAIILSILDFIKAIAASSEDEMKKAQGKFIKRLIVAALLFLIPLIINFLLQTFGVYNAKCDIGDLFS